MTARRLVPIALAASVLLAGCGPAKHLSMNLRAVSITVPRLVTPAVTIVPPSTAPVLAPLPVLPPVLSQLPPPSVTTPPVAPPPGPTCPTASPFAVPALSAATLLQSPPVPATYPERASGGFGTAAGGGQLTGTVSETVKALPRATSSIGQVVDSWSITRDDPARRTSSVELYRLVHASASPAATSPGIYLVGLAWRDPVRGTLSFQASGSGIFVLPSPVTLAQKVEGVAEAQYEGADTDPSTLTTLSVVRNVTGKKRVDACGSLIDTYTVQMTGVLTSPSSQRKIDWTEQVATSYGGLPVQDTLALSSASGDFVWTQTRTATSLPKAVAP